MSNQIVISSGAKVRELEGVLTGTAGVVNSLAINVPNGIPQLDGSGKILVSQLPNSVMEYKGSWNAATNTPTLVNGTGNAGDVYLCEVAGTVNFGAGPIAFFVGDQVIYSGTIWQRASGATGTVTSVSVTESGDALTITGSPITTAGTINIGFAGDNTQYINGAGGLTTFPSLAGFVPYTGATASVDLGTNTLTALGVIANNFSAIGNTNPSGNGGYIFLKQGIGPFTYDTGYNSITANSTRFLLLANVDASNNKSALLELGSLTNNTTRTFTLPDLSGTLALLEGTQTFSGAKTFSLDILVNGLTIGRGAGSIATNTVVGSGALAVNTTGNENTAIGSQSLAANTTGVQNTCIGRNTLAANTTGNGNFAGGMNALPINTTGAYNIAIGGGALSNNTTGDYNIAIGVFAGGFTTGIRNITIGPSAGSFILTGSNNTIIGNFIGTSAMSNNIVLADGAGNIRYQWNGTNNVFGNPISGTTGSFSSSGSGDTFAINHSSGSGHALNITKAGNGEGLYINKTSGTGNAVTIIGTLNATNLVRNGGTSSQFLKADGSVDSSTYLTTSAASSTYLPLAGGTLTGALSGTSAVFNHNDAPTIRVQRNSGTDSNTVLEFTNATRSFFIGSNGAEMGLGGTSGAISSQPLKIAHTTGAATFSSSVTAKGFLYLGEAAVENGVINSPEGIYINADSDNSGGANDIVFGKGRTSTSGGTTFMTIKNGGNVGIGTSSPNSLLQVGAFSGNNAISIGAATDGVSSLYFGDGTGAALYRGFIEYQHNEDFMRIGTDATERMRITSGGEVLINGTSNTYSNKVKIEGGANLLSLSRTSVREYGFQISSGGEFTIRDYTGAADRFLIASNGFTLLSVFTYNNTTTNLPNLFIDSSGGLYRSTTSSMKVKENIADWNSSGLKTILGLKPKTFTYKETYYKHPELEMLGLIAEEVAEVSPYLVEYENQDRTGEVTNVKYATIVVPLIKAVQELKAEIEELKALIAAK